MGLEAIGSYSAISDKGSNFCDMLFGFLQCQTSSEKGLH